MEFLRYQINKMINPVNIVLSGGLLLIILSLLLGKPIVFITAIGIPMALICLIVSFRKPVFLFYLTFILNYYIIGITRYTPLTGVSYLMDILIITILFILIIRSGIYNDIDWSGLKTNILFTGMSVWMLYCFFELLNPTAHFGAWITNRGLAINGFLITVVTTVLLVKRSHLKNILYIYSFLTLTAIIKVFIQRFIGWDEYETIWLNSGGGITHLIHSGIRYFSFFSDAGNFGSNMGCAGVILGISGFYSKNRYSKLLFISVSLLSFYAMMLSGTRGAIFVPIGGMALFIILSRNIKLMAISTLAFAMLFGFFAFTTIGESNPQIRRMRTAFSPNEDASYKVRKENRKVLAEYLQYRPFGEGIGLAGVENQKFSKRLTTIIPHDSTYVKIWVETGITGLIVYFGILLSAIIYCSYLILFKIKDNEIRGYLAAILCGIAGLLLSAYGNAFWGQYPTSIIAFTGFALIFNGKKIDADKSETSGKEDKKY